MKLKVEGIEEIEITDPLGLCNPPAPHGIPIQQQPARPWPPVIPGIQPQGGPAPQTILPAIPGDVAVPHRPPIYTRHVYDPNDPFQRGKWGLGSPMIQRAAQQTDPDKWEKNWQSRLLEQKQE